MQTIKLIIPGKFWDSHVYSGRLYLFRRDGAILTLDWDRFIDEWPVAEKLRLAMRCAFSRSDYLYQHYWEEIFSDPEIRQIIESKFERLSHCCLQCETEQLHRCKISTQDTPFPFPHTDARIYAARFYVSGQSGVVNAGCRKGLKYGVSTRPEKTWDAAVLSLATRSFTLAMAAGGDGLFETRIGETSWLYPDEHGTSSRSVRSVAEKNCVQCEWAYHSIYGSSHVDDGFLAAYTSKALEEEPESSDDDHLSETVAGYADIGPTRRRSFQKLVSAGEIFQSSGYSWANKDKIYQASSGRISVAKYQPWEENEEDRLRLIDKINLAAWKGDIVAAGVAVFGTVIECDNALVVLLSDGNSVTIPGEPVRWRVFPMSRHYENQLHVIYDDRFEIWSFNHDYFVDQKSKKLGIQPYL